MTFQSELIREELLAQSEEFRRLADEHAAFDSDLEVLRLRSHPTAEDEAEVTRLKKIKLQRKDQMERMIRAHRREQSEAVQAT